MEEWSPFRAYGPKYGPLCGINVFTIGVIIAGTVWFYLAARDLPAYRWNWDSISDFLIRTTPAGEFRPGLLLAGLMTTIRVGFWTFLVSLVLGGILGIVAISGSLLIKWPYQFIINILRNTPPIIILFCVYFLIGNVIPLTPMTEAINRLPAAGQKVAAWLFAPADQLDSMVSAVLALGLYQSAYVAEIVRGSLESVPAGQWEAGLALGFTPLAVLRLIILPQGMRLALPPLTGQCITTFKESSLASLISLPDLTFQSLEIMAISGMTFEVWICAGLLYLGLGFICATIGKYLEMRSWRHERL